MTGLLSRLFRRTITDPDARVIAAITLPFALTIVGVSLWKGDVYSISGSGWVRDVLINLHASALELLIGGLLITWLLRSRVSRRWKPAMGMIYADVIDLCDDAVRLGQVGGVGCVVVRFPSINASPLGPVGRFSLDLRPKAPSELRIVHRWRMYDYMLTGEENETSNPATSGQTREERSALYVSNEVANVQKLLASLDRATSNLLPLADRLVDHDVLHGMLRLAEACRGYLQAIQSCTYTPTDTGVHDWDIMLQVVVNSASDLARVLSQHGTVLTHDQYADSVHAYTQELLRESTSAGGRNSGDR